MVARHLATGAIFQIKGIYYGGAWYADITGFIGTKWRVGVGAQERNDSFFRHDRPVDNDDQVQLRQRQVDLFVTREFSGYRYLTLRGGYLFERQLLEGEPYAGDSDTSLELDDAPVVELSGSWWW